MADDLLNVEILADGTIKTESPNAISPANHAGAEKFLRLIGELTGSEGDRKKLKNLKTHHGQHQHEGQ